jgi:hypothetical protein
VKNAMKGIMLSALLASSGFAATVPPVAYVYVSTTKGIYLYDAAATGKLTRVGGPYGVKGLPIGSNGKYFFSVGTYWLHSYAVKAGGGIGGQVGQIDTQLYGGSECGATAGGVLDHTGRFMYVQTAGAWDPNHPEDELCDAEQSYGITSGHFTFLGDTHFDDVRSANPGTSLSITANDLFAYNTTPVFQNCGNTWNFFQRESGGSLNSFQGNVNGPPGVNGGSYQPAVLAADPANHLAAYMQPEDSQGNCDAGSAQLATYSVDAQGNLNSADTWQTMPAPPINVTVMNMSPAGNLLAVGGNLVPSGLMVYHYNGAAPITPYSGVLTNDAIQWLHWDKANHLYALSASTLYVYTVTPASILLDAAYTFPTAANGLFVVPR